MVTEITKYKEELKSIREKLNIAYSIAQGKSILYKDNKYIAKTLEKYKQAIAYLQKAEGYLGVIESLIRRSKKAKVPVSKGKINEYMESFKEFIEKGKEMWREGTKYWNEFQEKVKKGKIKPKFPKIFTISLLIGLSIGFLFITSFTGEFTKSPQAPLLSLAAMGVVVLLIILILFMGKSEYKENLERKIIEEEVKKRVGHWKKVLYQLEEEMKWYAKKIEKYGDKTSPRVRKKYEEAKKAYKELKDIIEKVEG